MQTNKDPMIKRDTATLVMCCLFVFVGAVFYWDTTNMLDRDSYVFPRAVTIAMVAFSLMLIVYTLVRPVEVKAKAATNASTIRRIALVCSMLAGCFAMPWLGFLIPGVVTFILLMLIAMYDEWSTGKKLLYPCVALAVVLGFYLLFGNLLQVPLPVGSLFE